MRRPLTACKHWRTCVECLWENVREGVERHGSVAEINCPECTHIVTNRPYP